MKRLPHTQEVPAGYPCSKNLIFVNRKSICLIFCSINSTTYFIYFFIAQVVGILPYQISIFSFNFFFPLVVLYIINVVCVIDKCKTYTPCRVHNFFCVPYCNIPHTPKPSLFLSISYR